MRPKSKSKVEMVEVDAKKPDDIVDIEDSFRAQLVVDEQQKDVNDCENVPPKHGCVAHLSNYLPRLMLDKYLPCSSLHFWGIFQCKTVSCWDIGQANTS